MTFEEQVKRLGEIVEQLESGQPTLEELNKLFSGEKLNEFDMVIRDGSSYTKFNDKIEIIKD